MEKHNSTNLNLLCSSQVNPEDATPMMRQFLEIKHSHTGVILFYRMGDFYETFFEDALIASKALEITLTGRDAGKLGRVPMAGVPVKAFEGYVQKLLEKNFKVAICEQVEDPSQAKGLVDRRVTRVLSNGTIADQRFLKPGENNFLGAAIFDAKSNCWGFAYCDVTTGEFYTTELTSDQFFNELERICPSELLVNGKKIKGAIVDEWVPDVPCQIKDGYLCTAVMPDNFDEFKAVNRICKWFNVKTTESFGLKNKKNATISVGVILKYLEDTYLEENRPVFDSVRFYCISDCLEMNAATRRHLELSRTAKDGKTEGTLLSVLDRTFTPMGSRLIRNWLQSPSIDLSEIESRLETVEALIDSSYIREGLHEVLPQIYDLERLCIKVQNLTAQPRDFVALKRSCQQLPVISKLMQNQIAFYMACIQDLPYEITEFTGKIDNSFLDCPAITIKEGNIFKNGFNAKLDQMREILETQKSWLEQYEQTEKERTGIKTLKLGTNSAFGYYIEISKALAKQAPPEYQRKQTLTNAERFTTPELKKHEEQVMEAQSTVCEIEYSLFIELRESLVHYGPMLKDISQKIAVLDVLQSFATVAVEQRYCKPKVDDSLEITLHEARHPVIEKMLPLGAFISNDAVLSAAPREHRIPQLMIITGPNMAGKSTYMRQIALIVIMAQMGSFVPASYARIGLVDQLFTRIGAVDDVARGQSTFMVEMTETAYILNCATSRSLVLLDEVGRGTSTYDGVSIAWSVAEHLINHNGCRTLFATHYHELNVLEQISPKIQNFRVLVSEIEDHIEFLHRVAQGAAQKSYGIQVAKMAGLPHTVIQQAERLMNGMLEKEFSVIEKKRQTSLLETAQRQQLSLFEENQPVCPS